jgi:hypothetical protein
LTDEAYSIEDIPKMSAISLFAKVIFFFFMSKIRIPFGRRLKASLTVSCNLRRILD